jgi:nitrogen fixation protein FixH
MFKKFNWGHGIMIFYICFVATLITVLVASFSVDHSLVVDDYYAQDLAYQSQFDKNKNSLKPQNIEVDVDKVNHQVTIDFKDATNIIGTVDFYRPSDKSKDFKVQLNGKETTVSTKDLAPGKWILKMDWSENGKSYYKEELVYL